MEDVGTPEERVKVTKYDSELDYLIDRIHSNAKAKGFWDGPQNFGEKLMLVVSEAGEAVNSHRKGIHADLTRFRNVLASYDDKEKYFDRVFESHIKDTVEDEIADTIIRLLDMCGGYNIDISTHIRLKMKYNSSREHKHGAAY
jgi:NTP pyrophosphatase (non-canonical NTP hydrolase)